MNIYSYVHIYFLILNNVILIYKNLLRHNYLNKLNHFSYILHVIVIISIFFISSFVTRSTSNSLFSPMLYVTFPIVSPSATGAGKLLDKLIVCEMLADCPLGIKAPTSFLNTTSTVLEIPFSIFIQFYHITPY